MQVEGCPVLPKLETLVVTGYAEGRVLTELFRLRVCLSVCVLDPAASPPHPATHRLSQSCWVRSPRSTSRR